MDLKRSNCETIHSCSEDKRSKVISFTLDSLEVGRARHPDLVSALSRDDSGKLALEWKQAG